MDKEQITRKDYQETNLQLVLQEMEYARLARASVWVELSDRPAQASDQEGFFHLTGVSPAEKLVRASQLGPWDTGYITFSGGVPVGGYSNLVLYPNGAINFSGHAHVSGAPSYDYSFVWAVKDFNVPATVYVFAASGRLHGTFESGSRDYDWNQAPILPALAAGWPALERGWSWRWEARVSIDLGVFIDDIVRIVAAGTAIGNVVKFITSDARLKRDICLLTTSANGLGVYRYRYLWSDITYVGVLAQEVQAIAPHAVTRGADGWFRVNYDCLGMKLMRWDEWTASRGMTAASQNASHLVREPQQISI